MININTLSSWSSFFALRVFDRSTQPILVKLLSKLDRTWDNRYQYHILKDFFESRVQKGESPTLENFDGVLLEGQLDCLEDFLTKLDSSYASGLLQEIHNWRHSHVDRATLQSIGRIWEDLPEIHSEVIIENDDLQINVTNLESSLKKIPRRSILLVGESGVGKTTILKVLGKKLADEGWVIFEAGAQDLMAGQTYYGELEQQLKRLIMHICGSKKVLWVVPGPWSGKTRLSISC